MINPALSDLPPFIVKNGGLNSGFMIPQVVAAALASENKILSHPASVDTIPTSADKEDHVSMGPLACQKLLQINKNVADILAIEWIAACEGLENRLPNRPGKVLQDAYFYLRKYVAPMPVDRSLSDDIQTISSLLRAGALEQIIQTHKLPTEVFAKKIL
jgi:histidine ammonia-lyase